MGGHVAVRDSKNPAAAHLILTRHHFTTLVKHLARPGIT